MLKGNRVYLRLIEQRDINILYDIYNEEKVKMYDGYDNKVPDKQYILRNFNKVRRSYKQGLSIVNDKGVVVGFITYNNIDKIKKIYSVGITIGSRFWGRGYGKDSLNTISKYIFDNKGAESIQLEVVKDNERAINCYRKVGFEEKVIKEKSYDLKGEYVDTIIMTLDRYNLEKQII